MVSSVPITRYFTEIAEPISGSHKVEVIDGGRRVRLLGLDLFCGYMPVIDEGVDAAMKKFTPDRVRAVVEYTQMLQDKFGQTPKLVLEHDTPERTKPPEAVGDIPEIWFEEKDGVGWIFGNVEMSREDFEAYIESNRYPRRSAEILGGTQLGVVCLLGRRVPRRPVSDTRFEKNERSLEVFGRPMPTWDLTEVTRCDVVAPGGGGNTYLPGTRKDKSEMPNDMDPKEECAKLKAELAEAKKRLSKYEQEDDDADDEDETTKAGKRGKVSKNARREEPETFSRSDMALFRESISAQRSELAELRLEQRRFACEREIVAMESEGYAFGEHREGIIEDLMKCESPTARGERMKFLRDVVTKKPSMVRVGAGSFGSSGLPRSAARTVDDIDEGTLRKFTAESVRESNGDPSKYRDIFESKVAKFCGA